MSEVAERHLYDRINDVSKLAGCNVRNFPYRWSIYTDHLAQIPKGSAVLDFGAGSLRESYDIASQGYRVTSVDMNEAGLTKYFPRYDWKAVAFPPVLRGDLPENGDFALVTAFDIIEHLEDPATVLRQIRSIMADGAKMFVTVPNRRTLREYVTKKRGPAGMAPGEPHLQFKSPREWRALFEACDFEVIAHDMAIGPVNNTLHFVAHGLRKESWHRPVAGALERIDRVIRPAALPLYGWNLLVLQKSAR